MRWFRFYDEVLDDPKVRLLPPALAWSWVLILCAANRQNPRGTVPSLSDLAFLLRLSPQKAQGIRNQLCVAGLLDESSDGTFLVHGWNVRQREYDVSTPRTRTFRERSENAPDTEEIQRQIQRRQGVEFGEREFIVPNDVLSRWVTAYPAVDVSREIKAAFEWAQANPANRKSNWQRFLAGWLKRAQDRAPRVVSAPPEPPKVRAAIHDAVDVAPMPPEIREQMRRVVAGVKMP